MVGMSLTLISLSTGPFVLFEGWAKVTIYNNIENGSVLMHMLISTTRIRREKYAEISEKV